MSESLTGRYELGLLPMTLWEQAEGRALGGWENCQEQHEQTTNNNNSTLLLCCC